jgi:predicted cytidylate kinase
MLTYNKITLSGVAGTGKSTVGKILKQKLDYEFVSVGNFAREYAEKEFGLTINAFQEKCRLDPSLDEMIDRKFKAYCNERSGIIADYRLGFKFIENAFHCLLTVSDPVAATRIQQGQRQGEAVDATSIQQRNREMRDRFLEKYGVDFTDTKNYHLVINTDALTPHAVADLIVQAFSHA